MVVFVGVAMAVDASHVRETAVVALVPLYAYAVIVVLLVAVVAAAVVDDAADAAAAGDVATYDVAPVRFASIVVAVVLLLALATHCRAYC